MFIVIGIMLSCLSLGYFLRNRARGVLDLFSGGTMITIYALLFVMGLELGADRAVAANILSIGWEALLISLSATLGSVLAAWVVFRLFFRMSVAHAAQSPQSARKSSRQKSPLTGSLAIVAAFLVGCLAGRLALECLPGTFSLTTAVTESGISSGMLYLLIAQVGIGVGSNPKLKEILKSARPRMLLLPAATIAGTLLFSLLPSLVISRWSVPEVMAVGSGFGYYSLSSILITTLKEATIGARAAELGTLALLANILREMVTLIFAPLLAKVFGPVAPIAAGGATTMDVTLPVISRVSGEEWIVASMIHGFLVDFSVPWIVPLFCSL